MTKQTRADKVLAFLRTGKTLTSMSAFRLFDITRATDVIYALRKKGHNIQDTMICNMRTGKRYKQWYLETP